MNLKTNFYLRIMATQFIQTISKFKVCISLLLVLCIGVGNTHAQDKKSKVRVTLKYIVTNNSDKQLVATVKSKIGRSYKGIENITVAFTVKGTDTLINMGNTVSDQNGIAILQVDAPKLEALNIPTYNFKASGPIAPYFYWPPEADISKPTTWGTFVFKQ